MCTLKWFREHVAVPLGAVCVRVIASFCVCICHSRRATVSQIQLRRRQFCEWIAFTPWTPSYMRKSTTHLFMQQQKVSSLIKRFHRLRAQKDLNLQLLRIHPIRKCTIRICVLTPPPTWLHDGTALEKSNRSPSPPPPPLRAAVSPKGKLHLDCLHVAVLKRVCCSDFRSVLQQLREHIAVIQGVFCSNFRSALQRSEEFANLRLIVCLLKWFQIDVAVIRGACCVNFRGILQ